MAQYLRVLLSHLFHIRCSVQVTIVSLYALVLCLKTYFRVADCPRGYAQTVCNPDSTIARLDPFCLVKNVDGIIGIHFEPVGGHQ